MPGVLFGIWNPEQHRLLHPWESKMRIGILRAIVFLPLLAIFLVQSDPVLGQTSSQAADEVLAAATKASLDADYAAAYKKVQEAKSLANGDLNFSIRFISEVTEMANLADGRARNSFLKQALKTANEVEVSKIGDGTQDAELSWNYMMSLQKLADSLTSKSTSISSKLYLSEAKIAANLRNNPGFPAQSHALLAPHLLASAYAHAAKKDEAKTLSSLQTAFDAGFTDFASLKEHEFIAGYESQNVMTLINTKMANYKQELKTWARNSITNFRSFPFKFDVADIDTGRIRNSDYQGRILVLDLWATWCKPCRESIPDFVKLDEKFRGDNVDVVGISMDNPDNPLRSLKVVRKFVDKADVEYAVALGNRSVLNQLAPGQKLPSVLFIDAQGQVRFIAEGPHNFCQLSAITDQLIEMAKESPTSVPPAKSSAW